MLRSTPRRPGRPRRAARRAHPGRRRPRPGAHLAPGRSPCATEIGVSRVGRPRQGPGREQIRARRAAAAGDGVSAKFMRPRWRSCYIQ